MATEITIPVGAHDSLTGIDHGGCGLEVLLVHGTGHNAAAFQAVAGDLSRDHRVVAIDLRGHGPGRAGSQTAEQYWRDIGQVLQGLGWRAPMLVGHSTGGYAVTAATAAGVVTPAGLCLLDGLVLDERPVAVRTLAALGSQDSLAELSRTLGYGLRLNRGDMHEWIETQVRQGPQDWLNSGAAPELIRAVARRNFSEVEPGQFLRRPTLQEVSVTTMPDPAAPVFPAVDVYRLVDRPMTVVLPADGFYASRHAEVERLAAAGPAREIVDVDGGHNVIMTRPGEVAAIIRECSSRA